MMMMSFDAAYRLPTAMPYGSQTQTANYNTAPANAEYGNNSYSQSYSNSSSNTSSSGNINGVPFNYSSSSGSENGVPFGYSSGNTNTGYNNVGGYASEGSNSSPFNSFSNLFGSSMGGGQSGMLQGSINNSGPVFAPNFGDGTVYAKSGDAYSNQSASYSSAPPTQEMYHQDRSSYDSVKSDCNSYCPPPIPMDYQEPPSVSYPPTHHYQQDYNGYKPTPINFPTMPHYGYTPNPGIPSPPEMSAAPRMPNYPTPMNMPSLGRQITPYGQAEERKFPPAPHIPQTRGPSEPPKTPAFYCPPPPANPKH